MICVSRVLSVVWLQGAAVGLVKNLALMGYISVGSQPSPILEFLEEWAMENLEEISPSNILGSVLLFSVVVSLVIVSNSCTYFFFRVVDHFVFCSCPVVQRHENLC